jgi:hypothetical protein
VRPKYDKPATRLVAAGVSWQTPGLQNHLVDLSTNRPLELLPDASAASFATWLQNYLGVKVIAHDRAGTFGERGLWAALSPHGSVY